MKQVVSGHALATETIMVDCAAGEVELQVYKGGNGGYFAIDGSWLEQCTEDDKPCYIPDPYNEGHSIQLLDSMDEKKADLVSGETDGDKQDLVNDVISQIRKDAENFDFTVLDELLQFLPTQVLENSLPEQKLLCGYNS